MEDSKVRQPDIYIEEFELVKASENTFSFAEQDVTVVPIVITREGKVIKTYELYNEIGKVGVVDEFGKLTLEKEYVNSLSKMQNSFKDKVGFDDKTLEELRIGKQTLEVNVQEQINIQREKEQLSKQEKSKTTKIVQNKDDNSQEITPEMVEQQKEELGIESVQACTQIRDARFYDKIPEARNARGFSQLVYTGKDFIVVSKDENGNLKRNDTIKSSMDTMKETVEIDGNVTSTGKMGKVMNIKGSNDAYSVNIGMSGAIEFQELRYDNATGRTMASQLYTTTQRPTKEEAEMIKQDKISDEIEKYEKAGYDVIDNEKITDKKEPKSENYILDKDEIEAKLIDNAVENNSNVRKKIEELEFSQKTEKVIQEIIENEKEISEQKIKDEDNQKGPWDGNPRRRPII